MEKIELKSNERITCTGEIVPGEYSSMWVVVPFKDELPDDFHNFIYDRIIEIGVDNGKKPEPIIALETGTTQNDNLYIDFGRRDTEYEHFEEYFESNEFVEWMKEAIKAYEEKNE